MNKSTSHGWGLSVRTESLKILDKRARVIRASVGSLVHSVLRPEREGAPRHERGVDGTDCRGSGVTA